MVKGQVGQGYEQTTCDMWLHNSLPTLAPVGAVRPIPPNGSPSATAKLNKEA